MKKIKSENGAITMLVLVSVLFIVSFLVSSYILISNKVQAQKEIIEETRKIYEPTHTMEEIYNSYFNNSNIVPIYTTQQLLMMGKGMQNVNINDKYYNFNNDENTIYVLMNDIKFRASDYTDQLTDGYWVPVGDRISSYEKTIDKNIMVIEPEEQQFKAKFLGKNNNIEVIYTDNENDEYSVIYSQESNYCEPEYEIKVIPTFTDGTVVNEAKILKDDEDTGVIGSSTIKVKRRQQSYVSAYLNENYTTPGENILIINPNKIEDISLVLNAIETTLTIETVPEQANVIINDEAIRSITVTKGTIVNYKVYYDEYYTTEGSIQVNENMTLNVELAPLNYIPFSESFYFTRCSDEAYNGLLNGGETSIAKYNLGGADYSMGTFYIDESDIIKKIPSSGTISKVTLYFEYYQDRDNTFLYTNTIKATMLTGTTEKMSQQETEKTNKTVQQAKYEVTNINRKDLEEGLSVELLNYIEGTLKITSSVKNMYCVIEGEKPDI